MEKASFDTENLAGNRVSKHNEHAYDEVMSPLWFDRAVGSIFDEVYDLLPTLPEEEKRGAVSEAFELGFLACRKEVTRMLDSFGKNIIQAMEDEINQKIKKNKQ